MNTRTAEKINSTRQGSRPVLYLVDSDLSKEKKRIIRSRTGFFFVISIAAFFVCVGMLLNIGLRIQNNNYQREILRMNEMIVLEEERTDRLQLEIAKLKNPSRIADAAFEEYGMSVSNNIEVIEIEENDIIKGEQIQEYIAKSPGFDIDRYDTFLGTIYDIRNIVMVVSESVLTFFIP